MRFGNGKVVGVALAATLVGIVPALAQDRLYPLIGADRSSIDDVFTFQCLLGAATADGAFVPYEEAAQRIRSASAVGWYGLGGGQGTGTSYRARPMDIPCDWARTTDADGVPAALDSYVGVGGDWPVMPGVLQLHSPQSQTYRAAAADYFASVGHRTGRITLTQVIRTDFEGDGVEEVVLTVTDYAQPYLPVINPGDHSAILLRRVVDGVVQTVVVDGELHAERQDFAAPLTFEVVAIADLNGDGVMEIVASANYYEGSSFAVYGVGAGSGAPQMVLSCGCGV